MSLAEQLRQEGREEGLELGQQKALENVAVRLYAEGMDPAAISRCTGFTTEGLIRLLNNEKS